MKTLKLVSGRNLAFHAALVLASFLAAPAPAQGGVANLNPLSAPEPLASPAAPADETPERWFIELSQRPEVRGTALTALKAEKVDFRNAAAAAGINIRERQSFSRLWNGLSVEASPSELARIKQLPGVIGVYPVLTVLPPEPGALSAPDLFTSIKMVGANIAHDSLGLTGAGIKVGVIDTGIDIDHPALGGSGTPGTTPFPSPRVVAGTDFVGDSYNADPSSPDYDPIPAPDANPDDCNGHGTHVSGIVGANGAVQGVAPGVKFGAYRVFGCAGSSESDIILAAMEQASLDGMDIVNMSLGAAFQWPQYPTAVASDNLVDEGVVVVCSAGNNGTSGLWALSAPGVGSKVIGVASYDNSHVLLSFFKVGGRAVGQIPMTGAPLPPTSGRAPYVYIGRACNGDAIPASVNGRIALATRGTCSFREKAINAINAGATAVLVHNNVPGVFSGTVAGAPAIPVPVVGISQADGLGMRNTSAIPLVAWTDKSGSFPNPTGGLISSFSSYGLSPDLDLKPDIGAPGGNIYSTYPLEAGGFATLSGTSMASPHVAGAAALFLEARPGTLPEDVRTILMNSADPAPWSGNPALGIPDHTHRQGAGMLDIDDAILSTTTVTPSKLALGESAAGPHPVRFEVRNDGPDAVTYDLSFVNAVSTGAPNGNGTQAPNFLTSDASVAFGAPSVAVASATTEVVVAVITPPTGPDKGQYGGYIVLTPQGGGAPLRVPFAGFVGDYQSIVVLTPTANNFPWLAKLSGGSFFNQPAGATYSMVGDDIPFGLAHFDHFARSVKLEILDAASLALLGQAAPTEDFFPRNSTAAGFFAFAWDGTLSPGGGSLSDGTYKLRLTVLKALGSPSNPAHSEVWISPVITIDRP